MKTALGLRHLPAALVIAISALCSSPAMADHSPPVLVPGGLQPTNAAAERHLDREHRALVYVNRAIQYVQHNRRSCAPPNPFADKGVTHDTPSQDVLDAIAALRRPAAAEDAIPAHADGKQGAIGIGTTYIDFTRTVTAADGKSFYVVINRDTRPLYRPTQSCLDAEHARLLQITRHIARHLRSAALEVFGHVRHGQLQNAAQPATPQDGIFLFSKGPHDGVAGGGGGANITQFRDQGVWISSGRAKSASLFGLVPDGVASITMTWPKVVSNGRWFKPTVYPSSITRTVAVRENAVSLTVARGAGGAFPARMDWRDTSGAIIHTFIQPR